MIRLSFYSLLLLCTRVDKSSARFGLIVRHSRNQAFAELSWKLHRIVSKGLFAKGGQSALGRGSIALRQRADEPGIGHFLNRRGGLLAEGVNPLVPRARVSFSIQIQECVCLP